jgi:hypothetical protein
MRRWTTFRLGDVRLRRVESTRPRTNYVVPRQRHKASFAFDIKGLVSNCRTLEDLAALDGRVRPGVAWELGDGAPTLRTTMRHGCDPK